ncbi:Zinc metalloproteinase nas-1, partial [Orchesella cincta]
SYTCHTPDEWLSVSTKLGSEPNFNNVAAQNIRISGQLWPSGIVKYKLNQTLSFNDIIEVKKAFDEYHTKTCIRFEPATEDDQDYVSIEMDSELEGGLANVCKNQNGGYQFARFGGESRNMATMVHELAHSLCLGHEHQRRDRDNYLDFQNCANFPLKLSPDYYSAKGIYDYASQMHYPCNRCEGAPLWTSSHPGLSVLDVDTINALYDCQGCHRHRWRPALSLTNKEIGNMHHFDQFDTHGSPIFPCRTVIEGELIAGRYNHDAKSCTVSHNAQQHSMLTDVEILTVPGGFNGQCSVYKLVNLSEASVKTAVQVGTGFIFRNWKSYLAYANVTSVNGVTGTAVGKVWVFDNNSFQNTAELPFEGKGYNSPDGRVLSCVVDTDCMLKQLFLERQQGK